MIHFIVRRCFASGSSPASSSSLAAALKAAMSVQSSSLEVPDETTPLDVDSSGGLVPSTSAAHPSFADRIRVSIAAGSGGAGCCAFDRGANRPRGPPSGGDGGHGGSVLLRGAAGQAPNLATFPRSVRAESGQHGLGSSCHGRAGASRVLTVPLGTVVRWGSGGREQHILHPDQEILLAAGGKGGRGNSSMSRGVRKRRREALSRHESGEPGQRVQVELELMTIADVAFVGAPNAGKSTLLRAV